MSIRTAATFVLAGSLLAGTAQVAGAQQRTSAAQGQQDCVLRVEPNGLIRGANQPKGCVMVRQQEVSRQQAETSPGVVCEERIIHTRNATRTVLVNCARLSGGRMVIPAVPPAEGEVEERHFGPLERHFGAIQSNFGPLERHFGSIQSKFGPLERHFGRLERNFGSSTQPKKSGG